jgi:hypothetical protein
VVSAKAGCWPFRQQNGILATRQPSSASFSILRKLARLGPLPVTRLAAEAALDRSTQGQVIDLGDVSAVAHYTVERDGFGVVATPGKQDEDAVPVRVVAVLAPDQSLTLSTPHEAGTPADAVEIIRRPIRCSSTRRPWRSRTERGPPRLIGHAAKGGVNRPDRGS